MQNASQSWWTLLGKLLTLAPAIVQGVEVLKAGAASQAKKQTAMDALLLASGVADTLVPGQAPLIDAATTAADHIIEAVVQGGNAAAKNTPPKIVPPHAV